MVPKREGDANPRLLLYLHAPFCNSKCHFCFKVQDIERKQLLNRDLHQAYTDAMVRSIRHYVPDLARKHVPIGLNFGGGTPTILAPAMLRSIVRAFLPHWDLRDYYFCVEGTPESLTHEKVATLAELGVNRLSIGVQSFDAGTLRRLGRTHAEEHVYAGVERARAAGLDNINLDLIISLPGEAFETMVASLQKAIALDVPHITTYFYNPTPGTTLLRTLVRSPELFWDLEMHQRCAEIACDILTEAGYINYEFFHWSRTPDTRAFVSLDHYFGHRGDVFAFGPEAQSFRAPEGNLQMKKMPEFLEDPLTLEPGKFDLPYALERALGCQAGLKYAWMARTFGVSEAAVRAHPLTRSLATMPGVTRDAAGLKMDRTRYFHSYAAGVHSRLDQILAEPEKYLV